MKRQSKGIFYLLAAAVVLAASLALCLQLAHTVPAADYGVKLQAAQRMERCMAQIRQYKKEQGIPLSPEDIHQTGLIGTPMTGITTTAGALEAKRTTANADMAALAVELLREAGVQKGDRVAASFSGSFPGLNLAVICASDALGAELVYISSVGASTYGANQPELTFPDMAYRLWQDGLISSPGAANTFGGDMDSGLDMEAAVLAPVQARLQGFDIPLLVYPDYEENLQARMKIYNRGGTPTCFVGVGGNMATMGRGIEQLPFGLIPAGTLRDSGEKSGLLQRYNAQGVPVIHLLQVKQLVAEYGLPFDPSVLPAIGTSMVYEEIEYPKLPAIFGIVLSVGLLLWGRRKGGAV